MNIEYIDFTQRSTATQTVKLDNELRSYNTLLHNLPKHNITPETVELMTIPKNTVSHKPKKVYTGELTKHPNHMLFGMIEDYLAYKDAYIAKHGKEAYLDVMKPSQ